MVMEIVISVALLFVGIAILVLIHVCIVGRAFGRGNQGIALINVDDHHHHHHHHHQRGNIINNNINSNIVNNNNKRMSIEDLKMIHCFDYVASSPCVDCAVCLESFKEGDRCRLLPSCSHTFHTHCIDSWLLRSPICPICRTCVKIGVILGEEISGIELI